MSATADEIGTDAENADALAERAIANGDEHVIKFTEACLGRHRVRPSPAYPAAIVRLFGLVRRR